MALVLILNRLQAPQPLVHVETWLAGTMLPELLGLDAAQCNDDRLARTLDTLLPHLDAIWQDLVVAAITTFDLDLRYLCYDLTSVSLLWGLRGGGPGALRLQPRPSPRPQANRDWRRRSRRRAACRWITVRWPAMWPTAPRRWRTCAACRACWRCCRRATLAAPCVVVSDRAMLTDAALAAYAGSGLRYLGPLDPGLGHGVVHDLLAAVSAEELAAHPLPYRPQRAATDPDWVAYQGVERRCWSSRIPSPPSRRWRCGPWWSGVRARPAWTPSCGRPT